MAKTSGIVLRIIEHAIDLLRRGSRSTASDALEAARRRVAMEEGRREKDAFGLEVKLAKDLAKEGVKPYKQSPDSLAGLNAAWNLVKLDDDAFDKSNTDPRGTLDVVGELMRPFGARLGQVTVYDRGARIKGRVAWKETGDRRSPAYGKGRLDFDIEIVRHIRQGDLIAIIFPLVGSNMKQMTVRSATGARITAALMAAVEQPITFTR